MWLVGGTSTLTNAANAVKNISGHSECRIADANDATAPSNAKKRTTNSTCGKCNHADVECSRHVATGLNWPSSPICTSPRSPPSSSSLLSSSSSTGERFPETWEAWEAKGLGSASSGVVRRSSLPPLNRAWSSPTGTARRRAASMFSRARFFFRKMVVEKTRISKNVVVGGRERGYYVASLVSIGARHMYHQTSHPNSLHCATARYG